MYVDLGQASLPHYIFGPHFLKVFVSFTEVQELLRVKSYKDI